MPCARHWRVKSELGTNSVFKALTRVHEKLTMPGGKCQALWSPQEGKLLVVCNSALSQEIKVLRWESQHAQKSSWRCGGGELEARKLHRDEMPNL